MSETTGNQQLPAPHKPEDISITDPYEFGTYILDFPPKSEIDLSNAGMVEDVLLSIIDRPDCLAIVVRFDNISFMDSSGLQMLINGYRRFMDVKSELDIENGFLLDFRGDRRRQAYRLLQLSGLTRVFYIEDDLEPSASQRLSRSS